MLNNKVCVEFLQHLKNYIITNLKNSNKINCPACEQTVKLYKIPLHSSMAILLINLYALRKDDFLNINQITRRTNIHEYKAGYFTYLRHWGLIEKNRRGFWRITELGKKFVQKKIKVKKYIYIYNRCLLRLNGEFVDIKQCLNERFNYDDIAEKYGLLNESMD